MAKKDRFLTSLDCREASFFASCLKIEIYSARCGSAWPYSMAETSAAMAQPFPRPLQKQHCFLMSSALCLSRACLGKRITSKRLGKGGRKKSSSLTSRWLTLRSAHHDRRVRRWNSKSSSPRSAKGPSLKDNKRLLFQLLLCLSRACLGKVIVLCNKMAPPEKTLFCAPLQAVMFPGQPERLLKLNIRHCCS